MVHKGKKGNRLEEDYSSFQKPKRFRGPKIGEEARGSRWDIHVKRCQKER